MASFSLFEIFQKRRIAALAIILFLFALCFRLPGISRDEIQPDELLWRARTHQMLNELKAGHLSRVTKFVNHPGATGVLVMGSGVVVGKIINKIVGWKDNAFHRVDALTACRVANALVSSLLIPVLFIFVAEFGGIIFAYLAAVFLALDPTHIALSRMAHLDSLLTLFVAATVLIYFKAIRTRNQHLKILAGIFLGLAISTKVPAVTLIPALLLFKPLIFLLSKEHRQGETVFNWGDLWILITSHCVLAVIYTRLWFHPSEYIWYFKVKSGLADFVYRLGMTLQSSAWLYSILTLIILTCSAILIRQSKTDRKKFHLGMFGAASGFLLSALLIVPQILENIILFWVRMRKLSKIPHTSYGQKWDEVEMGYSYLASVHLPEIIIFGCVLAVCFILYDFSRKRLNSEKRLFIVCIFLVLLCWLLPMSMAKKQAFRYLAPILPCLALLTAYAITEVLSVAKTFLPKSKHYFTTLLLILVVLGQSVRIAGWHPFYFLFANELRGGLSGYVIRGGHIPLVGQHKIVELVAAADIKKPKVFVLGEPEILEETFRLDKPRSKNRPEFIRDSLATDADFVVIPSGRLAKLAELSKVTADWNGKIMDFSFKGVNLVQVFRAVPQTFDQPLKVNLVNTARNTGHVAQKCQLGFESAKNKKIPYIYSEPNNHKKGFLSFGKRIRMSPGNYHLSIQIGIPPKFINQKSKNGGLPLVSINFGKTCKHDISIAEVSEGSINDIEFNCSVKADSINEISLYWQANSPVTIGALTISRVENVSKI